MSLKFELKKSTAKVAKLRGFSKIKLAAVTVPANETLRFANEVCGKPPVKLDKKSKHDSRAKASKTNRGASQNWKSGATLTPKNK